MEVVKRDGRYVDFDRNKIKQSVLKAFQEVDGEITHYAQSKASEIAGYVEGVCEEHTGMNIEDIQNIIEDKLMASNRKDVARAYIVYRSTRNRVRERNSAWMKAIKEKLAASNVQNQNANVDEHSFGGRKGEADSELMRKIALDDLMSEMSRNNHLNNEIYIHDLDAYAVGMHNCTKRTTKFITDKGVYSFEDFNDGDKVNVLTHTGEFKPATVHSYGAQKLFKIGFIRSTGNVHYEYFTRDHRWLLGNGEVTSTLKVGDQLIKAPMINDFNFDNASDKEKEYWCLGFVWGDGVNATRWSHGVKHDDVKFVRLRLCGNKVKYSNRFSILQHSTKELDNGDLYLTFSSTIDFTKHFPNVNEMTYGEQKAFFDGLYCADGQKAGHLKSIVTTDEQTDNFIKEYSPAYGWYITGEEDLTGEETNYATRGFTKGYRFIGDNNKYYWTVVSIEPDAVEEVWCLDVEDNHSFVLPNGIVTGNCLSVPFDKLLANGFNTRQTDVRPAQSVNTAFQLVAVIFQLQSLQQFGGVSATHLDWTMIPYVRKSYWKHFKDGYKYLIDKNKKVWFESNGGNLPIDAQEYKQYPAVAEYALDMTTKEVYQAVEGLYHNLNTLQSRSGNQLPFTSINYGTCTSPEGRMVTKALLDVSINGIGKLHKTPIFPCGIFQYMKGVNNKPGTPNYDLYRLALQSTAKRLYPNYANVDWSVNAGYDRNDPKTYFSTMGCRTSNGLDINGLGQLKDGRGNICPVTIIMPTLAMEVNGEVGSKDVDEFMSLLDQKIHEAKDMLIERYEWICSQSPESARFMYENGTMEGYIPEEGIRSALKHGTIVIGQLGLAETLQILIGCDHTTDKGMELAKRIEQLYKDRCAEFKQEYKLNFGVYYTPAENLCHTAMKKFQKKYGKIPNVSENEYFTNSIHVPVWVKVNPFEKIDIESQLTGYSNAGCITYVEMPDSAKHNIDALEELVNYAMDHDIPYFAINVPNDTCLECGYTDEIGECCPMCGSTNIQRLRRVTGYLTGNYTTAFNWGKQKEVEMRTQHTGISSSLEG